MDSEDATASYARIREGSHLGKEEDTLQLDGFDLTPSLQWFIRRDVEPRAVPKRAIVNFVPDDAWIKVRKEVVTEEVEGVAIGVRAGDLKVGGNESFRSDES